MKRAYRIQKYHTKGRGSEITVTTDKRKMRRLARDQGKTERKREPT